jgi:TetR/AcrR family transcriptional regulator, mexJK operon transcriptional repressor
MSMVRLKAILPETEAADHSPKRAQVIEAATTLFMAQGYGPVSMDALARAAGVSKATLYAYFPSKDALFATIVAEAGQRKLSADDLFADAGQDVRGVLNRIGQRMLRFLLLADTLAIVRVAIAESARFPELGQAFFANGPKRTCELVASWIAEQSASGRLAAPDAGIAAEHFMALLRGSLFLRATLAIAPPPGEAEIDAVVAAAVDTFMRAFGPNA